MFPIPPGNRNSYQVQESDRDLLTLAEKLQTDYGTLANLNPSITSISTGQYINIPGLPAAPGTTPSTPGIPGYVAPTSPAPNTTTPPPSAPIGPVPPPTYGTPVVPGVPSYAQPLQDVYPTNLTGSPSGTIRSTRDIQARNARLTLLKQNLMNATDPSQFPSSISSSDVNMIGYTPDQMLQAGYTLQNGNWVMGPKPGTPAAGAAAPQPTTNNNWQTNPSLHLIVFNKNAKNRQNRFVTTEKWARNAWKRKMRHTPARTEPAAEVRADTPSTTLDLVLGK